jgi:hypothetical protein
MDFRRKVVAEQSGRFGADSEDVKLAAAHGAIANSRRLVVLELNVAQRAWV